MRILIVDTCYPGFLKSLPFDPASTYQSELNRVTQRCFGTFDAYSRNLAVLGWETMDAIANHAALQELWAQENLGWYGGDRLEAQVHAFQPDVVFMQDLSLDPPCGPKGYRPKGLDRPILAGQCSCPWPGDDRVRQYDVIFTSFPHYIPRITCLGVKAVYNPLAFDVSVLSRCRKFYERPHDVVFIGGVGAPSHWKRGMEALNAVAESIPTFKWWGYGADLLPPDSVLRQKYQGEAWGVDMYEIMLQAKIVLNRHGEVAEGYANNMRLFEATGCGAMLLTETAPNISQFFDETECLTYRFPDEAPAVIQWSLENSRETELIAKKGQLRTLRDHSYALRMRTVSEALKGMIDGSGNVSSDVRVDVSHGS